MIQELSAQFAIFAALLLIASAFHKTMRWGHLLSVTNQFIGIGASAVKPVLAAAVAVEAAAGFLLLIPGSRASGAVLAAMLWTAYLVLIVRAVAQGRRDTDCGCSFGEAHGRLGFYQIGRNLLLVSLSAVVAFSSTHSRSLDVRGSEILAALSLLVLYGALDQVMALRPMRSGEIL